MATKILTDETFVARLFEEFISQAMLGFEPGLTATEAAPLYNMRDHRGRVYRLTKAQAEERLRDLRLAGMVWLGAGTGKYRPVEPTALEIERPDDEMQEVDAA